MIIKGILGISSTLLGIHISQKIKANVTTTAIITSATTVGGFKLGEKIESTLYVPKNEEVDTRSYNEQHMEEIQYILDYPFDTPRLYLHPDMQRINQESKVIVSTPEDGEVDMFGNEVMSEESPVDEKLMEEIISGMNQFTEDMIKDS